VLVGTTAAASATATMNNGQTQPVTGGWRSDAPGVATVTDGGVVPGVGNGEATILVSFAGRDGTKRIRVAPDYDGRWQGMQVITGCTATGDFAGICEDDGGLAGEMFPVGMTARHPGDLSVSGESSIENLVFPTFLSLVETDGTIRFSSATSFEGLRAEASWTVRAVENARATGTIREKYSAPGFITGDVTYESSLSTFFRGGAASAAGVAGRSRLTALQARIQAVRRRNGQ
jgi:hypothetical protein